MSTAALVFAAFVASPAAEAQQVGTWSLRVQKTDPLVLIYAAPKTQKLGMSLSCARGTGQISVTSGAQRRLADKLKGEIWVDELGHPEPWPLSVALSSGNVTTTLRGQADSDEINLGSTLRTEVSTRAPVIKAFAKTGVLKVIALGETMTPSPAPKAMLFTFLSACR